MTRLDFAPMEGVTGRLFREAHRAIFSGVDRYYMPFLSPTRDHVFTPRELRELWGGQGPEPDTVPQLLTRSSEDFLWAATALRDMGYGEVNLNLGCPSGTVTAKGKGAGFLARPQELERFLDQIFARSPLPVSIKTRLGMEREEEFPPLLSLFSRYPVHELIIHPRVRLEF